MNKFQSAFAERLTGYVDLRHRLGLQFDTQEAVLKAFDRYVRDRDHQGPLSQQLAWEFAMSVADTTTSAPARRYLVIRHFAEYLAAYDPSTPRLDPRAVLRSRQQPPPCILTEEDIERLLQATEVLKRPPVANLALRTMIGLAASTGLRRREVITLDRGDVDLDTGVIIIRRSKFDKDRLVPVHSTTLDALRIYASAREQIPDVVGETAFFLNSRGHRYPTYSVDYHFRRLAQSIELHLRYASRPTFRSLRHTFAVRRLVAWYRSGIDVQAHLPALATYMGHVHYTSTAYYLTMTAELLGVAADRLGAAEVGHGQKA